MSTQEVANRLVELCKQGKFEEAQNELFAQDAESIEPDEMPGFPQKVKGLDAIKKKGKDFQGMLEDVHGITATEPIIMGNSIAFGLSMDVTMKGRGRENMNEICVYEVKDGKITKEQFFW
ncbi:MAG: SnoaL-like domain-containing protein [Chitinophagaceae bacterium]